MGENILIITVGLPYSGKSMWTRVMANQVPIVCPDEIRLALHGQRFYGPAEPYVWAIARTMIRSLFGAGHDMIILDACNISRKRRQEWVTPEWTTRYALFPDEAEVCLQRAVDANDLDIVDTIERMEDNFEPLFADEEEFVVMSNGLLTGDGE